MGYTDTKMCWFHSRGIPPMPRDDNVVPQVVPMTFEEAIMNREEDDD